MENCFDFEGTVKHKYDYLDNMDITLLVNRAKSICVERLYGSNLTINYSNFDWSTHRFDMWILDCVDELIERLGVSSVVAYKENGMSWDFGRAGVSQALLDRIPCVAHTIIEEEE